MNDLTLGTYRNPPLAYVVAEVTIASHYGVAGSLPAIQERLRASYPWTLEETTVELNVGAAAATSSQPMWRLLSADRQRGLTVSTRGFSLHSTRYLDFAEFSQAWDAILKVMGDSIDTPFVERIGLRYVDFIVPSEGQACHDYLANCSVLVPSKGAKVESNLWASSIIVDGATAHTRVAAPSPPGMLLPPNIATAPLEKPAIWRRAEEHIAAGKQVGFIDTDCSRRVNAVYEQPSLSLAFRELKAHVSTMFKALMSPLAHKEWV